MVYMGKEKFIMDVAAAAAEDWSERHICLPSLVIAIAIEDSQWGQRRETMLFNELFPYRYDGCMEKHASIRASLLSHNNYIATWRKKEQSAPNWKELIGQENYILAVQYLQDARYPYRDSHEYEGKLVGLIEEYGLNAYDR